MMGFMTVTYQIIDNLNKFINIDIYLLQNSPLHLGSSKTLRQRTPAELDTLQLEVVNAEENCNDILMGQTDKLEEEEHINHSIWGLNLATPNIISGCK